MQITRYFAFLRSLSPLYALIALQSLFLVSGIVFLEFTVSWIDVIVVLTTVVLTEIVLGRAIDSKIPMPMSALAAGLGILLFLRATAPWYLAIAACIAIASKYVLRIPRQGHVFNPSNIAIVSLVFLFPSAVTIEFTQWGSNPYLFGAFAILALLVAWRSGVLATTLSFLAAYAGILLLLLPFMPTQLAAHHYGLLSPSLMLFACFMITDPRTSPSIFRERILHGISVALFFFVLEIIGVRYSLFVASFLIACMSGVYKLVMYLLAQRGIAPQFRYPKNIFSFGFIAILAAFFYTQAVTPLSAAAFSSQSIALEHLLMGTESSRILTCSANPTFAARDVGLAEGDRPTLGVSWGDYDRDGFDDVFLARTQEKSVLMRNVNGTFVDVTDEVGLPEIPSSSALWVDYDGDTLPDLFISTFAVKDLFEIEFTSGVMSRFALDLDNKDRPIRAFKNMGGSFKEITHEIGLDTLEVRNAQGAALSAADYDRDGDLDLVLVTEGTNVNFRADGLSLERTLIDPGFKPRWILACDRQSVDAVGKDLVKSLNEGVRGEVERIIASGGCIVGGGDFTLFSDEVRTNDANILFNAGIFARGTGVLLENRNGIFREIPSFRKLLEDAKARVSLSRQYNGDYPYNGVSGLFYQAISFDYDKDGDIDIFVSSDWGANVLLRNDGALHFSEVTSEVGLNRYGSGMGADVVDVDHDGALDIFVDNMYYDFLYLWRNDRFELAPDNIGPTSLGWGTVFLDYDLDGWDDLLIGSGEQRRTENMLVRHVVRILFRTSELYRNVQGRFKNVTWTEFCPEPSNIRPVGASDYDNDGDMDFIMGALRNSETAGVGDILYENTHSLDSFVRIRLIGKGKNTGGVGSLVSLRSEGEVQTKVVLAGVSYHAQNGEYLLFGLGDAKQAESVMVRWPSGRETTVNDVAAGSSITIRE